MVQISNYALLMDAQIYYAQKGGVCIKHGAKFKRCSSEGCNIVKGGVCKKDNEKQDML